MNKSELPGDDSLSRLSAKQKLEDSYFRLFISRIQDSVDGLVWKSRLQVANEVFHRTKLNQYTQGLFTQENISTLLIRSVGKTIDMILLSELEIDDGSDSYKIGELELSPKHPERRLILPLQMKEVYFYQQWKAGMEKVETYDPTSLPPKAARRALMRDTVLFRFSGNKKQDERIGILEYF